MLRVRVPLSNHDVLLIEYQTFRTVPRLWRYSWEAGASEPENLDQAVPTPGLGTITRSFRNPPRQENGSLPRNVCSTGSGP